MPYQTNRDLPEAVKKHLPPHAQTIYREAFNHALEQYKDPQKRRDPKEDLEGVSYRVAWAAVEKSYEKGSDGIWHRK